jgi:hypothetical protein
MKPKEKQHWMIRYIKHSDLFEFDCFSSLFSSSDEEDEGDGDFCSDVEAIVSELEGELRGRVERLRKLNSTWSYRFFIR